MIPLIFALLVWFSFDSPLVMAQNLSKNSSLDLEPHSTINSPSGTPIPLGAWNINSNGLQGNLNITSIDSNGTLVGSILLYPFNSPTVIKGYYDNISNKITFVRTIGSSPTDIEVYTGYKFENIIANCISGTGPGSCYQYATLAGTFQSFTSNQTLGIPSYLMHSDSERNMFGWYASHIPDECPACPH